MGSGRFLSFRSTAGAEDERKRYEEALPGLEPRQREAIIQRFELDRSHEEIAEELGIAGPNAARMRVERGRLRLAQLLRSPRGPS